MDVRTTSPNTYTYKFGCGTINGDPLPHLTSITNTIGTGEKYTFGGSTEYANQTLNEPCNNTTWGSGANTKFLTGVVITGTSPPLRYGFDYQWPWTGELSKVTLPADAQVNEPSGSPGPAMKEWIFGTAAGVAGMVTQHNVYAMPSSTNKLRVSTVWIADGYGKPYISETRTTYDIYQPYEKWKETKQVQDEWGNLTESYLYDWGVAVSSGNWKRRYVNTYLSTTLYVSAYIRNRLLNSVYTQSGNSVTLVTNAYDQATNPWCGANYQGAASITGAQQTLHDWANYGNGTSPLRGNVTWTEKPWTPYPNVLRTCFGYDVTGAVIRKKEPNGLETISTRDSGKNYAVPSAISVGSLSSTNLSWNSFLGLQSSTPNTGASTSTAYDTYARPTSRTVQAGGRNVTVNIAYPTLNTTVETIPAVGTIAARWTRTTTDGFGRPVKVESGKGAVTPADPTTSVVGSVYEPCAYTPTGKVRQTSRPYAGNASATAWTLFTYDALGRTISVRAPDGASTTAYEYKGEMVKVTDASGKWKLFKQDAFGNLAQVNEPNPAGGADYVTSYTYNMRDQLINVSMPRPTGTQTRDFGYDLVSGAMLFKQEPETDMNATDRTVMGYDSFGRLAYKTDAKNQMVEFDYDQYNRVLTMKKYLPPGSGRQWPGNCGPEAVCEAVTFTYDNCVFSRLRSRFS